MQIKRFRKFLGLAVSALVLLGATPLSAKPKEKKSAESTAPQLSRLVLSGQFREALDLLKGFSKDKGAGARHAVPLLRLKFLAAYLNLKAGNPARAVELFQEIRADYDLMKDYVDFYMAVALRESGKAKDSIKLFTELGSRNLTPQLAGRLARELSLAYCKAGDRGAAIDRLNGLIQDETSAAKTYHLRFDRAQCLLDLGDKAEALPLLKALYLNNPEGDLSETILARLQNADPQYRPSAAEHRQRAELLMQRNRPELAVQDLEAARRGEAPSLALQKELGQAYFKARQYREAAAVWGQLLREPGAPFGSPEERLDLAKAYARSDQFDAAVAVYQDLIDRSPQGDAAEYLFKIAFIRMDQGKLEEANRLFADLLQRYPQHPKREQIYWYLAWDNYRLGKLEDADQGFARFQAGFPSAKNGGRAAFWRARILEKQGKAGEAKAAYEALAQAESFSYYGFLSLKRLENLHPPEVPPRGGWAGEIPRLDLPAPFSLGQLDANSGKASAQRLRELLLVGLWEDFLGELDSATAREGVDGELRALSLESNGTNGGAAEASEGRWNQKYPPAYATLISLFSRTRNLPMALAWAIMREESHFQPRVVSAAQAIGLMQIIPPTGYQIAKELGRNTFSEEDLYRPVVNVEYGVQYLTMNLRRLGGNLIYTIASYNAGPDAVERWIKERPNRDWEEFVEEIPYAETQDYVRKVLKSFYLYSLLYNLRAP